MTAAFTVYIVDDEEPVRDSLSVLLEMHGFQVHCFSSGRDFLAAVKSAEPGCVLCDLQMPEIDGLRLLAEMTAAGLKLPVVMMTGFGQVATAVQAMKSGALDFLEKPLSEEQLLSCLERAKASLDHLKAEAGRHSEASGRLSRLTPREREIFDRLALGMQNKMVAQELDISPRTVELHRARIMEKLGATSLSDLVRLSLVVDGSQDQA
ncbi:MAG TPA: response regulator [Terriglobales bacterium]|nr:response regulator [Terriglobales bacterium]